jgi:hypothetical protein
MFERLTGLWRRKAADVSPDPPAPAPVPRLDSDTEAIGVSSTDWCRRRRERSTLYSSVPPETIARLRERDGGRVNATLAAAERLLQHEFDLLGSGPYMPRDPDRGPAGGYAPIDWYIDPVRRLRFPRGVPYKQWNLLEMRPQNADIKYPWELARCQHWPVLGQAYRFTHDDHFAIEIARELDDFVEANPTGVGVNWTCTMDVGLRVVSWAIGLELVHVSAALDDAFWTRAYTALFDHGVFIRNNLENTYEVTSNHFLSNLLGLQFAGAVFQGLERGEEWATFARASIEHEMQVQVLTMAQTTSRPFVPSAGGRALLGAARLAEFGGHPLSSAYCARLRMVVYLAAVTRGRPDAAGWRRRRRPAACVRGIRGDYAAGSAASIRSAGAMFDEPAWVALGGGAGSGRRHGGASPSPEDSFGHPALRAMLFPKAGIAVARNGSGDYLLITNGIVGTNGFGTTTTTICFAFEFHRRRLLFVDPGSYVYTSDADSRNRFRGTGYHNTVMIDCVEQNEWRPDWLFRLFETSHAETTSFHERGDCVEYVGRHHGYERLPQPVTHERTFRFDKPSGHV